MGEFKITIDNQKVLNVIKWVGIIILSLIFIFLLGRQAIITNKKDAEFVKQITNEESMEKVGESIGKTANELDKRKKSFIKGFNKTREKNNE